MLTLERLKEIIDYNPESGIFIAKIRRSHCQKGDVVGCNYGDGYMRTAIDGRDYLLHRLAWFYVYGQMPKMIDHINGDRGDNRIENLRIADYHINARNSCRKTNSSARFKGISWHKVSKKWQVQIRCGGELIPLGYFDDDTEAAFNYDLASLKYHREYGKRNFMPLMIML